MPARLVYADGRAELVERCLLVVDTDAAGNERVRFAVQPKPKPQTGRLTWRWVPQHLLTEAKLVPDVVAPA